MLWPPFNTTVDPYIVKISVLSVHIAAHCWLNLPKWSLQPWSCAVSPVKDGLRRALALMIQPGSSPPTPLRHILEGYCEISGRPVKWLLALPLAQRWVSLAPGTLCLSGGMSARPEPVWLGHSANSKRQDESLLWTPNIQHERSTWSYTLAKATFTHHWREAPTQLRHLHQLSCCFYCHWNWVCCVGLGNMDQNSYQAKKTKWIGHLGFDFTMFFLFWIVKSM